VVAVSFSGISYEGDLLDLGVSENVIDKSGAWFNYGSVRLGQGREQARQFLKENAEVAKEIHTKIMVHKFPPDAPVGADGKAAKVEKSDGKSEKGEKEGKESKEPKGGGRNK